MPGSTATGDTTVPLLEQTIGASLEATAARFPDREALVSVHQGVRMTYATFDAAVDDMACRMLADGLAVGDRLGIWAPNCAEWALVQYATAKIGVVLVNVNPAYRTHEVEYALRQSGCRWLIAAPSFKTSDYVAMVAEVRGELPDLERVLFLDTDEWSDWLATDSAAPVDELRTRSASLSPDDAINIQYTSGTTGFPKGATLSHRNILNNGYFVGEGCGYTEHDRVCVPVPLYHCFGMVMGNLGCTTHGATIVYPAPAFDPLATLQAVQDERCTSLYGVPTMFIAELGHPQFDEFDLTSLRTGIMAGSPCPVEVMKQTISAMHMGDGDHLLRHDRDVARLHPDRARRHDRSAGRHRRPGHPHVEIKIVDTRHRRGGRARRDRRVLHPRLLGDARLLERSRHARPRPSTPTAGCTPATSPRWTPTATCNIVGRIKDMVIRGGENIYPREVEEFLYGHPDIVDVQVIGVPDEKYGEELMAWVQLREGAEPMTPESAARVLPRSASPTTRCRATCRSSTSSR